MNEIYDKILDMILDVEKAKEFLWKIPDLIFGVKNNNNNNVF